MKKIKVNNYFFGVYNAKSYELFPGNEYELPDEIIEYLELSKSIKKKNIFIVLAQKIIERIDALLSEGGGDYLDNSGLFEYDDKPEAATQPVKKVEKKKEDLLVNSLVDNYSNLLRTEINDPFYQIKEILPEGIEIRSIEDFMSDGTRIFLCDKLTNKSRSFFIQYLLTRHYDKYWVYDEINRMIKSLLREREQIKLEQSTNQKYDDQIFGQLYDNGIIEIDGKKFGTLKF